MIRFNNCNWSPNALVCFAFCSFLLEWINIKKNEHPYHFIPQITVPKRDIEEWFRTFISECPDGKLNRAHFINSAQSFFPANDQTRDADFWNIIFDTLVTQSLKKPIYISSAGASTPNPTSSSDENAQNESTIDINSLQFEQLMNTFSVFTTGLNKDKIDWGMDLFTSQKILSKFSPKEKDVKQKKRVPILVSENYVVKQMNSKGLKVEYQQLLDYFTALFSVLDEENIKQLPKTMDTPEKCAKMVFKQKDEMFVSTSSFQNMTGNKVEKEDEEEETKHMFISKQELSSLETANSRENER